MHVARLLPASILRAFRLMGAKFLAIFADAPVLFFAVVIGVALTFRIAVGVARDAATPEPEAPTFATAGTSAIAPAGVTQPMADPDAKPSTNTTSTSVPGEVGAAAKVQPIGRPAHVAPKPRGHGRRPAAQR